MSLINYLTRIHFADDILEDALQVEAAALRAVRPLVVADRAAVRSGAFDRVLDVLRPLSTAFALEPEDVEPSEAAARAAAARFAADGCDLLVACGGGGAIDLAKATAILAAHDGPLASYAATEGGIARIRAAMPPIIAVPTTAGAGSEVSGTAAILAVDGRKLGLVSSLLIPRVAICDPTLTLQLPPALTASSGMDAVTHCIETYIAMAYNPPADGIALDGLKRAAVNLERAVDQGSDLDARREMMAASMNGALAFQKGLGGVHAMSHALGALSGGGLDHGALNAVLLPHVLEFNAPAVGHRYPALAAVMTGSARGDLADAVSRLAERLGLPRSLAEAGVAVRSLEPAATLAERDHTNSTNPRIATAADYLDLMRAAM